MSSDIEAAGRRGHRLRGKPAPAQPTHEWLSPVWEQRTAEIAHAPATQTNGRTGVPRWESRYASAVIALDLGVIVVAVTVGALLGFGSNPFQPNIDEALAAATTLVTVLALIICRAWEPRVLGQGSEEFSRLARAMIASSVVLGLGGLLLQQSPVRPWVFVVIPGTALLALLGRYTLRRWLHARRGKGFYLHKVLAIGTDESVSDLVVRTRRSTHHGWQVAGACTPSGAGADGAASIAGVPVVGDLDALAKTVTAGAYRVVAVAPAPGWTPTRLQQLAWDIEGSGVELVVHPGLTEVAGPRLHVNLVDGLPLLRLTEPGFTGVPRVIKAVVDQALAGLMILLLAPLLLGMAVAVKLDGGPVFFRQTRVGRNGRTFAMIKFRSMVVNAEQLRAQLSQANDGAGPLFKLRADPRITKVGAWMRKYSLDELPQLFNVLLGSMSIVGPRPPLPHEVEQFSRAALRRLLVKPGMTGLWQISGRSDLSWEESVRLDLQYVENWTLALDAMILWKTVGAVVRGEGAY